MTKRPMNGKAIDTIFSEMLNLLQDHQDLLKEAVQILDQDMKYMEELMKAQENITQKNSELERKNSLQSEQIRRLQKLNVILNDENDSLMKQNEELLSLKKN